MTDAAVMSRGRSSGAAPPVVVGRIEGSRQAVLLREASDHGMLLSVHATSLPVVGVALDGRPPCTAPGTVAVQGSREETGRCGCADRAGGGVGSARGGRRGGRGGARWRRIG